MLFLKNLIAFKPTILCLKWIHSYTKYIFAGWRFWVLKFLSGMYKTGFDASTEKIFQLIIDIWDFVWQMIYLSIKHFIFL